MKEAAVQTSVNVALNQNDMVELMLEEQKEIVENQIEAAVSDLAMKKELADEAWETLSDSVVENSGIRKSAEYKRFAKILKQLKFKEEGEITVGEHKKGGEESFVKIDWSILEGYSKPMPQYKKLMAQIKADEKSQEKNYHYSSASYRSIGNRHYIQMRTLGNINADLSAVTGTPDFSIHFGKTIRKDDYKVLAKTKKLMTKYEDAEKAHFQAKIDLQKLETTLFTLEHDNVRNKAKFVKGLLANSDTGKELVKLMGTVKGSNLVQIGEGK